jgi:hypothetical protein
MAMADVILSGRPRALSARPRLWVLLALLFAFLLAALTWSAARAQTQKCESWLWKSVVYNLRPDLYAKKCGCPKGRSTCNPQYLMLLMGRAAEGRLGASIV